MDLKDFIKETMIQIAESVIEVQQHFDNKNIDAIINPREIDKNYNPNYSAEYSTVGYSPQGKKYDKKDVPRTVDNIEFDVAMTVEKDSKKEVGGKLKVLDIGIGAEANETNKLANVSKIRFKIPLVLPHGKENK